jgi:hypothetical protein
MAFVMMTITGERGGEGKLKGPERRRRGDRDAKTIGFGASAGEAD